MPMEFDGEKYVYVPTPRFYTEEEWAAILEREAQENFGMSVAEFFEAWKAGKFKGDRERHDAVVGSGDVDTRGVGVRCVVERRRRPSTDTSKRFSASCRA